MIFLAAVAVAIDVSLDPRLETLGLSEWLSGRSGHGFAAPKLDKPKLEPAQPAPAEDFDFLTRTDAVMRLTPPPALKSDLFMPDLFLHRAGGRPAFEKWRSGLAAFSANPLVEKWLAARRKELEPVVASYQGKVDAADYRAQIEKYIGMPLRGKYSIRLSEFHAPGSQINVVTLRDDGTYDILSLMGPADWEEGRPKFDPGQLPPTAWHELAHGLTDELVDLYSDIVRARAGQQMSVGWDCYGGWTQCVKEHVVRAVMIRLLEERVSHEAAERELDKENKRFPWLSEMVAALELYEERRADYPTLGHFMPELIGVIPPAAAAAVPAPAGQNWLDQSSYPFSQPARRKHGLELLSQLPRRSDLLARRAGLLALDGRCKEASSDASLVLLEKPDSAAAVFIKAWCLQKDGKEGEARAQLERVSHLCDQGGQESGLCNQARELLSRLSGGKADSSAFFVDPRLELLGAVFVLARPKEFEPRQGPYINGVRARFAPFAKHAAVRELEKLLTKGSRLTPASTMLRLSDPPELALRLGAKDQKLPEAFVAAMRDFALKTNFMKFYHDSQHYYGEFVKIAVEEAAAGLSAAETASYLRLPAPESRFALTVLLPAEYGVNAGAVRTRSPSWQPGAIRFDFDEFAADPGHEAVHSLIDRLGQEHSAELEAYSGLMKEGCTDSWNGCVLEHVDLAVTLRALAKRDPAAAAGHLKQYESRGFPYLVPLTRRLQEYEKSPDASFESFYPRLIDVFGDLLGEEARAKAKANVAARAAKPASMQPNAGVEPNVLVEPRVELAAALSLLAGGKAAGPYAEVQKALLADLAPFREHAAVERAGKLAKQERTRAVMAQLLLNLSPLPALEPTRPLPEELQALLGGKDSVDVTLDELRDFAAKSMFLQKLEERRAAYLPLRGLPASLVRPLAGKPRAGRPQVLAVSPLLAPGAPLRLESGSEDWYVASAADVAPAGEIEPEVVFDVDPRLELLSILALLGRGKAWPEADPEYSARALSWFKDQSGHPAVALVTRRLARDKGRFDLLASLALRLSRDMDALKAEDSLPEGYSSELGGEESVEKTVETLADFAKRGKLKEFLEKSAPDHERFRSAAKAEAQRALSPKAAALYLGRPFGDRYVFLLAGLLPQQYAANVTVVREGRVNEYRVRSASWKKGSGVRFGFDHFGNSVAHELIHLVTNPLAAELDVKGRRPPPGCNDQQESTWSGCAQEHLVYVVTMRLVAQDLGEPAYKELVETYRGRGFPFLLALGESLKEYEKDRGRWPAFVDYWPKLSGVFSAGAPQQGPAKPSPSDPQSRRLRDEGVKAFVEGKQAEAEGYFRESLKLAPADSETLLNLGVVLQARGRLAEASKFYERAAVEGVRYGGRGKEIAAAAWSSHASLLRGEGKAAEEKAALQKALDVAPSDWEGAGILRARLEELK